MFIAIAMTGLDQEMMQKNLLVLAVLMLVVVAAFLLLGGLLTLFAREHGLAVSGDALFPAIVTQHLPAWVQAVFVLALVSALLPSTDGAHQLWKEFRFDPHLRIKELLAKLVTDMPKKHCVFAARPCVILVVVQAACVVVESVQRENEGTLRNFDLHTRRNEL